MLAIFKREIKSFFTSPIGYLVIGFFLVLNGLFLWVFRGQFNLFEYGFADLSNFFLLSPWVLLFLIPAVTMKSFSEEKKLGTLELLFIKPVSLLHTVLGKFFGSALLAVIAILPTLLYTYSISELGTTVGNVDLGMIMGSYFGLLFLICSYTAIGLFSSTLSESQIVSFILGVVICFLMFYGFEGLSSLIQQGELAIWVKDLGMKAHFENVARGILDTRDMVYFLSLTLFFVFLSVIQLKNHSR